MSLKTEFSSYHHKVYHKLFIHIGTFTFFHPSSLYGCKVATSSAIMYPLLQPLLVSTVLQLSFSASLTLSPSSLLFVCHCHQYQHQHVSAIVCTSSTSTLDHIHLKILASLSLLSLFIYF